MEGQRHAPAALYPGKDTVPIVQEAGWAPGPVWTGAKNLTPTGIRSPDHPARSESLYRLSYQTHDKIHTSSKNNLCLTDIKDTTIKKSFECITSQKLYCTTTIQTSVSSGNNLILKYSCRGVIKLPHLPQTENVLLFYFSGT